MSIKHLRCVAAWPVCTGGGPGGINRLLAHVSRVLLLPLDGSCPPENGQVRTAAQKIIYSSGLIDCAVKEVLPLLLEARLFRFRAECPFYKSDLFGRLLSSTNTASDVTGSSFGSLFLCPIAPFACSSRTELPSFSSAIYCCRWRFCVTAISCSKVH